MLMEIFDRLDKCRNEIQERVESEEFLTLMRKSFEAYTQEKRQMLKLLITNAAP